jgi:hypothetical protein
MRMQGMVVLWALLLVGCGSPRSAWAPAPHSALERSLSTAGTYLVPNQKPRSRDATSFRGMPSSGSRRRLASRIQEALVRTRGELLAVEELLSTLLAKRRRLVAQEWPSFRIPSEAPPSATATTASVLKVLPHLEASARASMLEDLMAALWQTRRDLLLYEAQLQRLLGPISTD